MNYKFIQNRGITVIALVITIIILIILSGVVIVRLKGQEGIFNKSKKAVEEYLKSQAKEELQLIITDLKIQIYDQEGRTANLNDFKYIINQNEKIVLENEEYNESNELNLIEISYEQKYLFGIDKDLNIIDSYIGEEEIEQDVFVEYTAKDSDNAIIKPSKLKDKTENAIDAELKDAKYNDNGKGIFFDGTTTYGTIDSSKIDLSCPITITVAVKWENGTNNLLFLDAKSKMSIGTWNNELLVTSGNIKSYSYALPDNFFQNDVNYITVQYDQSVSDNIVYVNGEKMNKSSYYGSWNKNESGTYIGRRASGSYFKGIIYDFKIYNKLFTEQEVIERYQKEKTDFENNTNTANEQSENLILEYLCNKGENEDDTYVNTIRDRVNNKYNIDLNDVKYNDTKDGLVFNGTSSYGEFDESIFKMSFPNTITIIAKCNKSENRLLFTNKASKIGIGLWQSKYIILENDTETIASYYNIESEFLSQNINYITVVYGNDASDNTLYLNGKKIESTSKGNGWISNESGTYLGRRSSGSYFDGILYKLKIYSRALSESEIIKNYQIDKEYYSNNN